MNRLIPPALALVSGGALIGGFLWRGVEVRKEGQLSDAGPAEIEPVRPPAETASPPGASAPRQPPLATADALAQYERQLAIQEEISVFVQNADRLVAKERTARTAALAARIDELEAARIVVGAQGYFLRAALARSEFAADPTARDAALASLEKRYSNVTPSTAHLDARYLRLKLREQEIVREANARDYFPDGLTKDAYLRRELDAALRDAYSSVQ